MKDTRVPPPDWTRHTDQIARECGVVTITYGSPIGAHVPCHYCGEDATTRDHVVADAVLGMRAWWNLVPACEPCNTDKADRQSCSCMFCLRAMALWSLGFRRVGTTRSQKERARQKRRREESFEGN